MKEIFVGVIAIAFFAGLIACRKGAGEGGSSTIRGKVIGSYKDVFGNIYTFDAAKEDVYIIYDDADFYGDKVETSHDGSYQFKYLRKGSYTLFAYSDCDTCPNNKKAAFINVEITKANSTIEADIAITKD